mmetsp:Transcript_17624/g.35661  ORF Transcript_17624/g.35661 Transcript_17624/m.35661 type:complete len:258 (-) Transcript_17624:2-775(-)
MRDELCDVRRALPLELFRAQSLGLFLCLLQLSVDVIHRVQRFAGIGGDGRLFVLEQLPLRFGLAFSLLGGLLLAGDAYGQLQRLKLRLWHATGAMRDLRHDTRQAVGRNGEPKLDLGVLGDLLAVQSAVVVGIVLPEKSTPLFESPESPRLFHRLVCGGLRRENPDHGPAQTTLRALLQLDEILFRFGDEFPQVLRWCALHQGRSGLEGRAVCQHEVDASVASRPRITRRGSNLSLNALGLLVAHHNAVKDGCQSLS